MCKGTITTPAACCSCRRTPSTTDTWRTITPTNHLYTVAVHLEQIPGIRLRHCCVKLIPETTPHPPHVISKKQIINKLEVCDAAVLEIRGRTSAAFYVFVPQGLRCSTALTWAWEVVVIAVVTTQLDSLPEPREQNESEAAGNRLDMKTDFELIMTNSSLNVETRPMPSVALTFERRGMRPQLHLKAVQ